MQLVPELEQPELAACTALFSVWQVVGLVAAMHVLYALERVARLRWVAKTAGPLEVDATVAEWQLERLARPWFSLAAEVVLVAVLAWQAIAALLL